MNAVNGKGYCVNINYYPTCRIGYTLVHLKPLKSIMTILCSGSDFWVDAPMRNVQFLV